jgi:hypothetical protein
MASPVGAASRWPRDVRRLLYIAMGLFLVTIAIGIVNGLDLYQFDRNQLLTHVHSGTLGWITLSIVAWSAWFARGIQPRLAAMLGILIPIYIVTFFLAIPGLRALAGAALLVGILWLVVWAWRLAAERPTLPALAIALGLSTFTYGAIIGVIRQVQLAGGPSPFPASADIVGAHAAAMVFSYLILVAMGLLEWRILGTTGRPTPGLVQVLLLFAGGVIISGTLLLLPTEAIQAAGGLYLLVEIIAVGIFAVRVVPAAVRIDWGHGEAARHLAAAAVFVLIGTAIFLYVIYRFIADPSIAQDPTSIQGVLTASDHAAFIGVMTNLVLGLAIQFSADRHDGGNRWTSVAFWSMNIGLLVFLVGLIADNPQIKRIGSPTMGVGILIALAIVALRLRASDLGAAES